MTVRDKIKTPEPDMDVTGNGQSQPHESRPIWEVAAEIAESIPMEDRANVPHDGSINHRHYRHGSPRVELTGNE